MSASGSTNTGWINGMLPIVEEIKLDTSNTIHIGQSVDGTYAVSIDWCTGTAGGGSHPSVWDEPVRDYKEAVRQGIRLLERQYNKAECWSVSDRSQLQPEVIRSLKEKLLEISEIHTAPTVKPVLIFTNYKIISYGNKNEQERSFNLQGG